VRTKLTRVSFALLWAASIWIQGWAAGGDSDEAIVQSLDEQERAAILSRDRAALERLLSDQFTVNSPTNRVGMGRDAVLALIEQGVIHYSSFERKTEFLRVEGDLGIVMGSETVQPIGDAPSAGKTVQRRFTNIWRKEAGTWRMIARHANVIPSQ